MVYYVKIAEIVIRINCAEDLYLIDDWKIFFEERWGKNYLIKADGKSDIEVIIKNTNKIGKTVKMPVIVDRKIVFDGLLSEALLVDYIRRLISIVAVEKKLLLLHASSFCVYNSACLVTGPSGSGKSTLLYQAMEYFKPISEDLVLLKIESDKVFAYPTPLNLKVAAGVLIKQKKEVKWVLTVKKNEPIKIEKMTGTESVLLLVDQTRELINDPQKAKLAFTFGKTLKDRCYKLRYNLGNNVIDYLKIFLKQNEIPEKK